jgi:hypothetical protein
MYKKMINVFSFREIKNSQNYVLQLLLVPIVIIMAVMFYLLNGIIFYGMTEISWFTTFILRFSSIGFVGLFIIGHILESMGIANIRK